MLVQELGNRHVLNNITSLPLKSLTNCVQPLEKIHNFPGTIDIDMLCPQLLVESLKELEQLLVKSLKELELTLYRTASP